MKQNETTDSTSWTWLRRGWNSSFFCICSCFLLPLPFLRGTWRKSGPCCRTSSKFSAQFFELWFETKQGESQRHADEQYKTGPHFFFRERYARTFSWRYGLRYTDRSYTTEKWYQISTFARFLVHSGLATSHTKTLRTGAKPGPVSGLRNIVPNFTRPNLQIAPPHFNLENWTVRFGTTEERGTSNKKKEEKTGTRRFLRLRELRVERKNRHIDLRKMPLTCAEGKTRGVPRKIYIFIIPHSSPAPNLKVQFSKLKWGGACKP